MRARMRPTTVVAGAPSFEGRPQPRAAAPLARARIARVGLQAERDVRGGGQRDHAGREERRRQRQELGQHVRGQRPEHVPDGHGHRVEAHDLRLVLLVRAAEEDGLAAHPGADRARHRRTEARRGDRGERREQRKDRDGDRVRRRAPRRGFASRPTGSPAFQPESTAPRSPTQNQAASPADRPLAVPERVVVERDHRDGEAVSHPEEEDGPVDAPDVGIADGLEHGAERTPTPHIVVRRGAKTERAGNY